MDSGKWVVDSRLTEVSARFLDMNEAKIMKFKFLVIVISMLILSSISLALDKVEPSELVNKYNDLASKYENVKKINEVNQAKIQGLEQRMREIERKEIITNKAISLLKTSFFHNLKINKYGSLILLFGLIFEVIGATFLAGSNLTSKIESIFSLKIEAEHNDLGIENDNQAKFVNFFGISGSLFLMLGFILQFSGTTLITGITISLAILFVLLASIFSFLIIIFLSGQTPGQTRKEKFKILCKNITRLVLSPILNRVLKGIYCQCDMCLKYIKHGKGEVWYIEEKNSSEYPYLYLPYNIHYGHPDCLKGFGKYNEIERKKVNGLIRGNVEIHKESFDKFVNESYQRIISFIREYKRYWKEKRNDDEERKLNTEIEIKIIAAKLVIGSSKKI